MAILYFCTDGILRIKSNDDKYMFSVKFVQQKEHLSDFSFWAKWWNQQIVFEEGLTFAQFFDCLSPWLSFWGEYTQKDLVAYYKELKKPTLTYDSPDNLDWLSIDYKTELRPVVNYGNENDKIVSDVIKPEEAWHLYSYYELTGYILNQEKAILVDWLPLNTLANLPIILNSQHLVMIDEFFINKYGIKEQQLINQHGLGVKHIHDENDHEAQFSYLQGPKTHTIREVIEGVFYRFDQSPEIRDSIDEAFLEQENDWDEDDIAPSSEDSIKQEMIELDEIYEEQRTITSMKAHENVAYFNELLQYAKSDSYSDIRIGKIKEAKPLENRILSWIKEK